MNIAYVNHRRTRLGCPFIVFASALPIEVFGHVLYACIGKRPYWCARSRRTRGLRSRPVSGPCPSVPYAAARCFWPGPRGSGRPRLRASSAVRIRLSAMPCMPVTSAGSQWMTSPDPAEAREKTRRDRLLQRAMAQPSWALGFRDEGWWSRLAQPDQPGWTDAEATPKLQALTPPPDDSDPKALACDGLLVRPGPPPTDQRWRRFVVERPVSAVTLALLAWCSTQLAIQGFTAVLLSWDHASWHRSPAVRHWLQQHNQQVKRGADGVRLVVCRLPSKSPWLNPIEPTWVHGQRAVSEADRRLSAAELEARVSDY